jgi:hypothetical protein
MGMRTHIPQRREEFTAEWFTSAVGSKYDGVVSDVSTERIGEGIGFLGELYRCHLTWDRQMDAVPSTVVVKVPSRISKNRALGELMQVYEREIGIYSKLRSGMGIPMPGYVYSAMDSNPVSWLEPIVVLFLERLPVGGAGRLFDRLLDFAAKSKRRSLLIIEDIDDARPVTQAAGGTVEDAAAALVLLARFHGANWMDHTKVEALNVIGGLDRTPKIVQASYRRNRDGFVARFGSFLSPAQIAVMDEVQSASDELLTHLASEPWTLVHGDFRLDNLMFRDDGEIVALDFQGVATGRPGWDVGYFIMTALDPEHCGDEEMLLRTYHDALLEAGVSGYAYEQLVTDNNLTKAVFAHRMVAGDALLDTDAFQGEGSLVELLVERMAGWIDVD